MGQPLTAAVRFLSGEREPVRVATTGNIELSGLQTIDGVALAVSDRVLVKDQTDATENGILLASEGDWFRASDASHTRAINEGVTVHVQEGTVNNDREYRFTSLDPVVGVDPITLEWSGPQAAQAAAEAAQAAAEAAQAAAEAAAEDAYNDVVESINPLLAVKLQTVASGGELEYDLISSVPSDLGHLHVNVFVRGAKQPKDGSAYTIINGGQTIRLSEYPGDDATIYVEGSAVYGSGISIDSGILNVKTFGATTSILQLPAARRVLLQLAIDAAALVGSTCLIPAGTWLIDSDLFYRDNSRIAGAGEDITIVKLDDAASVECCVFRPADFDVRTYNVSMSNMTGDANGDRATVTGNPVNRPAGTAFCIAHTTNFVGVNLHGKDAVLHGIDIAPGGDLDGDGIRQYRFPGGEGVYSTKRSEYVTLINCKGSRAGDDAITTHHCGPAIQLFGCGGHSYVQRYQTAAAPNGLEIDDGSSDVTVVGFWAHDVNRAVAVKCHADEAAARRVRVFGVDAWRCTQAVFLGDDNATTISDTPNFSVDITVDGVNFREPLRADPLNENSLSGVQVRAFTGATVKGVRIDGAAAVEALGNAIIFTDGARACTVADYSIRNWGSGATPVVQIGTNSIGNSLLNGRLINCQAEIGVSVLGSNPHIIDGLYGDGSAVANSVLLSRASSNPFTNGIAMNVVGSGYTSLRSQGGTTATRHRNVMLGDVTADGYLHAGSFTNSDFHRLYADKAENSEMLRIDDQTVSLMRAYTTGREFYNVNSAAHVLGINMNNTTSRSINANGTINASGADYAEYHEVKPHLYGAVSKGAVLGFASDGLLTDRFAEVVGRFAIKSTSPNLVGGDTWGETSRICDLYGVDPVGEMPELSLPDFESDEPTEQERQVVASLRAEHAANIDAYHERLSAFDAAMEAERVKWDRIAKSGYLPVNITATMADIGKYLVPADDGSGGITATLMDMNAAEDAATTVVALKAVQKAYRRSIGVVIGIADDGRPLVEVKVG